MATDPIAITPSSEAEGGLLEAIRAVTDHEAAFFDQNGWVLLRELVSPDLCRAMLERGRPRLANMMQGDGGGLSRAERNAGLRVSTAPRDGRVTDIQQWVEWRGPVRVAEDPVFTSVVTSPTMGGNVKRLHRREVPMRVIHDIFTCKLPDKISTPTDLHQDSVSFPLDRNALTVWIALDEIKPEQGPVQFYSGSHRMGMMGRRLPAGHDDLVAQYPDMARYPLSPPHHLRPGDATVHHGLVVHGTGANNGVDPRWSYLICFFPSDALYSGAPNHDCDGFDLKLGQPVDHPSFTLVG